MRDETREVLNMLMHSFPSLGSWFAKQDRSLSETWSKVLSHVDPDDVMTVAERFIRGDLDLPANYEYDRLAIIIRREAAELARRRSEVAENDRRRKEQEEARSERPGATSELERFHVCIRKLINLGHQCRDHQISREDNDRHAAEVRDYYHGRTKQRPECMT